MNLLYISCKKYLAFFVSPLRFCDISQKGIELKLLLCLHPFPSPCFQAGMLNTVEPSIMVAPAVGLRHMTSKLDLLDSTTLTSFPIPHPIKESQGGSSGSIGKLRPFKSYPIFSSATGGMVNSAPGCNANNHGDVDDEYEDYNSGNFTSIIRSSTILTPPSSTEIDTSVEFDYREILDESFKQLHSTPSIDKCNDAYLRSILSDKKDLGTLYYCSLCDNPLYELSGFIPDDLQHRELICETCSSNTNNDADDDTCTMQIVDELDVTLQSEDDEFNTTTIIRGDGSAKFQSIISNLRSISNRDLRLRQSMIDLKQPGFDRGLWTMIREALFGTTPLR